MGLYIYVLLLVALITLTIPGVEAATQSYQGKAVGIIIEKSCLISTNCLDYSDIVSLDNTDPKYMGGFVEKNGDVYRNSNSKHNNYRWLEFQKNFTIIVDPPLKFHNQIPMITIVSKLDEYHLPGQDKIIEYKQTPDAKATEKIRSYSHTRYVGTTCYNAIITAKNYQVVLPDTINYLRMGCDPNHTKINSITLEKTTLIKHDIAMSSKAKLDKFYAKVLKECTKTRNACTEIENRAITTNNDVR